jgi:hypothetical protein
LRPCDLAALRLRKTLNFYELEVPF